MEEHYMYNLPLERFAFLTGRSLTTFKSDFKKIFKMVGITKFAKIYDTVEVALERMAES